MTSAELTRALRVAALQLFVPDAIAEDIADDCMHNWEWADWDIDETEYMGETSDDTNSECNA